MDIHERRFGTDEPSALREPIDVGPLDLVLSGGNLTSVTWHGVEVVRGINCLVRDEDWGTYLAQNVTQTRAIDPSSGNFNYLRRFSIADDSLAVEFSLLVKPEGELVASARLTAHRDFRTNRAGLTLLHPVQDVAGGALRVTHPDGTAETVAFPQLISPGQPVFAIAGLAHDVRGITVAIRFEGEVFEMEDQRNWSDASFKTYCRPLALPCPYVIARGETIQQTIRLSLSGRPDASHQAAHAVTAGRMPEIMLALEHGWSSRAGGHAALVRLGMSGLLLRIEADERGAATDLRALAHTACSVNASVDLEIVLRDDAAAPGSALAAVASQCAAAGLSLRHVIALPQVYLKSHQPTDPVPAGPTPEDCLAAVRAAFPAALAGAGMLTNFTEFNRRRPPPGQGDYVTHGSMATVHAADDIAVFETLEALPQICESGRHIAGERPYRLGLVSIGMRSNPHGAGVVPNPENRRRTMTAHDPRQRGLFAAAYAVGVAVAAAFGGVQALALAAPTGPFGVMEEEENAILLFPIFHAIRVLSSLSGGGVTMLPDLPAGVVGIRDEAGHVIVANCSVEPKSIHLAKPLAARLLDSQSHDATTIDADWLARSPIRRFESVELEPCACLFGTT